MTMKELQDKTQEAADLLYANYEKEGMEMAAELLGPIQQQIELLIGVFSNMAADTQKEEQWLINCLKQLVEAYKNCDIIKQADLLKYEVLESLKIGQELMGCHE